MHSCFGTAREDARSTFVGVLLIFVMSEEQGDLIQRVYTQLHELAQRRMSGQAAGQTLQATALVHEAWLKLSRDPGREWRDSKHYFATAAEAMRQILIYRARKRQAQRHGGGLERVDAEAVPIAAPARDETMLAVSEALDELASVSPERAEIVKLRFFVGMTAREAVEILGVTERTVERHWAYAKAWLFDRIEKDSR